VLTEEFGTTHPGEADRVPLRSRTSITREGDRTLVIPSRVEEVVVVQHPERVDPWYRRVFPLLPIQPPEVHALILERMMEELEVRFEEFPVGWVEYDGLGVFRITICNLGGVHITHMAGLGVSTESLCHLGVGFLVCAHSVGGMSTQRGLQMALVQLFEELDVVGEELIVPPAGVSRRIYET
jgi:hypothetical protein